jgi:hypothetical protein
MTNILNGMTVIARTADAVYLRIPADLQVPSAFAGKCTCGNCDGSGKWDTLVIGTETPKRVNGVRPADYAWTCHMPDKAVQPFIEYQRNKARQSGNQK